MSPAATGLAALIRAYQLTIRPVIGAQCRFEPDCSHYAMQALKTHGAVRGLRLTASRLLRCHPWHAGGYDPVPPRAASSCHPKGCKAR
jgi:uncharacterized protein